MTPEGEIKAALKKRIKARGGRLYFVQFLGLRGAPDCYVVDPVRDPCWVETKAGKDGRLSKQQALRHAELRSGGAGVLVIRTLEDIDRFFPLPKDMP